MSLLQMMLKTQKEMAEEIRSQMLKVVAEES
jgi:hypothetical protein